MRTIRGRVLPCDLDWKPSNLTPASGGPQTMKLPVGPRRPFVVKKTRGHLVSLQIGQCRDAFA